jgi:hypothetical protein
MPRRPRTIPPAEAWWRGGSAHGDFMGKNYGKWEISWRFHGKMGDFLGFTIEKCGFHGTNIEKK